MLLQVAALLTPLCCIIDCTMFVLLHFSNSCHHHDCSYFRVLNWWKNIGSRWRKAWLIMVFWQVKLIWTKRCTHTDKLVISAWIGNLMATWHLVDSGTYTLTFVLCTGFGVYSSFYDYAPKFIMFCICPNWRKGHNVLYLSQLKKCFAPEMPYTSFVTFAEWGIFLWCKCSSYIS